MRFLAIGVVSLFLLGGTVGYSQQASVRKFTATFAGSVVLRDVPDKYNAQVSSMEMPDPDASAEQRKLHDIKELIKSRYPHQSAPAARTSSSVLPPIITTSFVADSFPGIPPDNYMAVNDSNKAVTVMNSTITVHDASTGAYLMRKQLITFSASVGLNNTIFSSVNYRYDPKVVYDPAANKFICVMLNSTDQYNYIVLGFSQSSDPTGTWNFYKFYGDYTGDTTWFDYPAISVTKNEFFLTGNKIKYDSSWQAGFTRSLIYQVRKQDGYNGDSLLHYQIWDSVQYNNHFLRCLYPLNPGDSLQGPAQYFLSNRNFDITNDTVFLVQVPDTIGSTDSILTVTPVISSSASYGVPPDGRQPDTTIPLATNDGRILGGFIKGNEIQFVSTSVDPAYGSACVYHGIISNFTTSPALGGALISTDSLDYGYPNISYAGTIGSNVQSIISFDYSGPHTYAGYGAVYFDGSNYSDMLNIISGDSTINMLGPGEQRWGDYSGSQPDWTTTGAVWCEGIYGRKNQQYGNYIARLASPYRVSVPATSISSSSRLYPNPGITYVTFDFSVAQEQVFSFVIYDMQGRVVDKVLDNYCAAGRNLIRLNIQPLPPGSYLLKAAGNKGETFVVHQFVKQ